MPNMNALRTPCAELVVAELSKLLRLLCPMECVDSIALINIAELKRRGIRALLTDLDNTLVPWQSYDVAPGVAAWIRDAVAQGMEICIVSNTRSHKRLRDLAATLGVRFVRQGSKPRRRGFRDALRLIGAEPEHAAVMGDQVLTDILGGNRLGMYTILVRPLHPREFVGTKVSRLFEGAILRLLVRRGMLRPADDESCGSREQSGVSNRLMKTEQGPWTEP